ncbi:hypothetical protein [Pseudoruegeria sp. HB172150]|uniref:hypothetical protein n=1 Tax=Pseudoruegeria sp. HB172150 TaxID=2721164 RepID=UPI0015528AF1|nr:hypothetical protein [Pseudoruegeria sp. HB172150]
MAVYDNTYSRVVSWLKVLLPLLALALLSTLFLVARAVDPAQDLPYADVDIDELTREQRVGRPTFTGMTGGGAAFTVSAESARPDPETPDRFTASDLSADIDLPSGVNVGINASEGVIGDNGQSAGLGGDVSVIASNGYRLDGDSLNVTFDTMRLWSDTAIAVTGPGVNLTADSFELTGDGTEDSPQLLVFNGNVRLLYEFDQ